ncbi:Glutathione-dependent formaldehyde-activating enzyme [Lasiodiplodia theobromae]|uniref:CENP-V/GFA domain-containing protein n=1 Tax=Lasiodiplodia theobromae TaxID=45133 RepID=A0A5N5DBZ9_9PEZI|nr:Glutathione-dependent formaldehyde-activating enzyme [Lasiodiplodia theobromae]KAB2575195.1 hypothetical protein DBV05_g6149 [Lasiodiplodia theobromae]KAF4541989.1 Glutathione-dependent formaldehyde-activating enzyme [Lasiodiplodia theobromae]
MSYTGGCQCGKVKYTFTSEPIHTALCYCTNCQRQTGSTNTASLTVAQQSFTSTGAAPKVYSRKSDAGADVHNHFCGDCGTTCWLTGTLADSVGMLNVRIGTLDDLTLNQKWAPKMEVYCREKYAWLPKLEGTKAFDAMVTAEAIEPFKKGAQ